MFDVGFAELFLLALIGLLVLGPERLPGVARTVGGFVRKARTSWVSLRNTIESELAEADLAAPIKKTSEELKQIGRELTDASGFKEADLAAPIKKTSEELKQIGRELTDVSAFESEPPKPDTTESDALSTDAEQPAPLQDPESGKSENA